ncbi:MAG: hypothetical protein JXJ17_16430 [Anaerolineae bacterium]|nr:hypothetical protein [Anaerolineae bacterium]
MNRAVQTTALVFGIFAGGASIEHGIFEILQGPTRPEGIMIASMGPPCDPELVWNACEPAMTIIPSFLISGILSVAVGLMVLIWSLAFLNRKHGGWVLLGLSITMLLVGGGIFPPLIGIVGGVVGTGIDRQLKPPGRAAGFFAALWPWTLIVFSIWLLAQWIVGYYFNDFIRNSIWGILLIPVFIIALIVLSPVAALAHDKRKENKK